MTTIDRKESQVDEYAVTPTDALAVRRNIGSEPSIGIILASAVERNLPPDVMEKLVGLFNQQEDRRAAREFSEAMAAFQEDCPPIAKTSTAKIVTNSGSNYSYNYAELDEIARTIRPILHKHGLSYSWDSAEDKGALVCTCTIRHANGHSVASKFSCSIDSAAKMSGAQKSGAALTYARRQSLIQALGLTTCDPDSDGALPKSAETRITEEQAGIIENLIVDVKADRAKFLAFYGVGSVKELPASCYKPACKALEGKRKP